MKNFLNNSLFGIIGKFGSSDKGGFWEPGMYDEYEHEHERIQNATTPPEPRKQKQTSNPL